MKKEALTLCLWVASLDAASGGFVPDLAGDPDLIRPSPHQAYYRVSVDSKKWWTWGLGSAPVEQPSAKIEGMAGML
jgi:hypothetical protein